MENHQSRVWEINSVSTAVISFTTSSITNALRLEDQGRLKKAALKIAIQFVKWNAIQLYSIAQAIE